MNQDSTNLKGKRQLSERWNITMTKKDNEFNKQIIQACNDRIYYLESKLKQIKNYADELSTPKKALITRNGVSKRLKKILDSDKE